MLKCETTLWRWQPPDGAHYVIVSGRVTLARNSDQTLACIHFTIRDYFALLVIIINAL